MWMRLYKKHDKYKTLPKVRQGKETSKIQDPVGYSDRVMIRQQELCLVYQTDQQMCLLLHLQEQMEIKW